MDKNELSLSLVMSPQSDYVVLGKGQLNKKKKLPETVISIRQADSISGMDLGTSFQNFV